MKIWDWHVRAEVKVDPKVPSVYMDCDMSPIEFLGGLIAIQRSETNKEEGPKLFIDINPNKADVNISGKAFYFIFLQHNNVIRQ